MAGHVFKELEHILLVNKRHLAIYLCELGLAVGTQIFITETLGNLEIAVEATHHQQLLQRLRALRKRVELAWIHAAGHHEIAGTLGGGTNQNGRFNLDEVLRIQEVANQDGHAVTQFKILTHTIAAQVQIAVLHANVIAAIGLVLNGERWCLALAQHIQFLHQNLNVARRHLGILALALAHITFHLNAELASQFVGTVAQFLVRSLVEHQLSQSITVAQVGECHTTHLPHTLNPSGKRHALTGV